LDFNIGKLKDLTEEEEDIFEKNITWLFGNARGGTSWVSLELLSHQTNSINEPHIDGHISMAAFPGRKHNYTRSIDNPQKNLNYFFSAEYKDVWMKFLRKLILNRFYAQTKNIHKKTIIKELVGIGALDILTECMSKAKIIILLRDGRDVLDSTLDAQAKDGFMAKAVNVDSPIRKNFVENFSLLWTHRNEHFLKTFNNKQDNLRYMVKYEDILKDTSSELEKLYKFLEIEISKEEIQNIVQKYDFKKIPEDQKGRGKFHRSASPGKWKEHFTPQEIQIMTDIMNQVLKKLNYL